MMTQAELLAGVLSRGGCLAAGLAQMTGALGLAGPELEALRLAERAAATPIWAWPGIPELSRTAQAPGRRARAAVTDGCIAALPPGPKGLVPEPALRRAARPCAALGRALTNRTPTDASAWLMRAHAARHLDHLPTARFMLERAYRADPGSAHAARMRLRLAADLDGPAYDGRAEDMRLVAKSWQGQRFLAGLYRAAPRIRPALTAVLEGADHAVQNGFLRALRQMSGGARP